MRIDGRSLSSDGPPYVIAEISANHLGSKAAALELIHAAHEAGADAVKFQHYKPSTITVRSMHPDFLVRGGTLWDGEQLADLYAKAMMPWEWTPELIQKANGLGLTWFSSPFDITAVDFLEELKIPAYKIASFEIVDLPLIRYAASKGKPLIISTGMATVADIDSAMRAALVGGAPSVALLRCNSGYPALPEEMGLRAIPAMMQMWDVPVGLSDHTHGSTAAVAAVALGGCVIEKHLTLRRSDGGPDAAFSAEPSEFADLVIAVRQAQLAIGTARFGPSERERASVAFRRSLRAVRPIAAGELLTMDNVRSIRPAGGLAPDLIDSVLGMVAARDLDQGAPLSWPDIRASDG